MATAHPSPVVRQLAATRTTQGRTSESADAAFARRMGRVMCVALPVFVALWVGLIALAVTLSDVGYAAPLAMGAGVGLLAGLFWAAWFGFVAFSHHEESERRSSRAQ